MCVYHISCHRRKSSSVIVNAVFAFSQNFFYEGNLFVLIMIITVLNVLYFLTRATNERFALACLPCLLTQALSVIIIPSWIISVFIVRLDVIHILVYIIYLAYYMLNSYIFIFYTALTNFTRNLPDKFAASRFTIAEVSVFIWSFGQTDRHGPVD